MAGVSLDPWPPRHAGEGSQSYLQDNRYASFRKKQDILNWLAACEDPVVLRFIITEEKCKDKLEVLANSEKRDDATEAGKEMIQLLTQIETDGEYFPIQDVQLVCKIIDPYGIDEELTELCRKFILKQE